MGLKNTHTHTQIILHTLVNLSITKSKQRQHKAVYDDDDDNVDDVVDRCLRNMIYVSVANHFLNLQFAFVHHKNHFSYVQCRDVFFFNFFHLMHVWSSKKISNSFSIEQPKKGFRYTNDRCLWLQ